MADDTILVVGGSGFVGRHLVSRLVSEGHRVTVPTRRRERARDLFLLPTVTVIEADVRDTDTLLRLTRGATAVINLVGILNERAGVTCEQAHVETARNIAAPCKAPNVRRLLQMSGLNAAPDAPSRYLRSKAEAEALVAASGLD